MHILITGGTGTIGSRLTEHLLDYEHQVTVISRQRTRPPELPAKANFATWDGRSTTGWGQWVEQAEAIVNLAGAGLADARWTTQRKRLIRDSRVQAGQAVLAAIRAAKRKPNVLIQASAIGYYGSGEEIKTEASPPGHDFLAEICQAWEASTALVESLGVRRVVMRTGIVLDPNGGAFPKMARPVQWFVGGPLGSGQQWLSWIHHWDMVAAIRFLIENESLSGAVNLTAPQPLRQRDFAKLLGLMLNRPAVMPVPALALKLILGEMVQVVLEGQQVLAERLPTAGFQFSYPEAWDALRDLVNPEWESD